MSKIFAEGFVAQGRADGESNAVIIEAAWHARRRGFLSEEEYHYIVDGLIGT